MDAMINEEKQNEGQKERKKMLLKKMKARI